jgi:hypothetical protein
MKQLNPILLSLGLGLFLVVNFAFAGDNTPKNRKTTQKPVEIRIVAWGPTQAEVDAAKSRVEQSTAVQDALKGTKYRVMSFDYIETGDKSRPAQVPTQFRVIFYDYTNNRTFVAEGDFAAKEKIAVRQENFEPGVSGEELEEAFEMIKNDSKFVLPYKQNKLTIAPAMPPTSYLNGERLVNISIKTLPEGSNQIVGISFKNGNIVRYENNAPPTAKAEPDVCGIPSAGQSTTSNGTAGQYQVTILQNGTPLWEMLVIRPSASSGRSSERSGIEVRDVRFRGKSVLKRGHAPILNVQYAGNVCGPYRDWQYQEGMFNAPSAGASDPAPGIRILAPGQIATTALDTGNDTGNFRGVAIYMQDTNITDLGPELVMVSEMNAGWYRYIMEWRFAPDGTIRPRYGFGATTNSCVCATHFHHVYWRFDFDIVSPINNIYQVEIGPAGSTQDLISPIINEVTRLRDFSVYRSFIIQNSTSNEAYLLSPNLTDGTTDAYGGGDVWFLRYQAGTGGEPAELDDPNSSTAANLAPWLNNESLSNQDSVIWYAGHFTHADNGTVINPDRSGDVLSGEYVIGPDIRPLRW